MKCVKETPKRQRGAELRDISSHKTDLHIQIIDQVSAPRLFSRLSGLAGLVALPLSSFSCLVRPRLVLGLSGSSLYTIFPGYDTDPRRTVGSLCVALLRLIARECMLVRLRRVA